MTTLDFESILRQERAKLLETQTSIAHVRGDSTSSAFDDIATEGGRNCGIVDVDEDGGDPGSLGLPQSSSFAELAHRPPLEMEKIRVGTTSSIFYAPDFVSESEGEEIMSRLYSKTRRAKASTEKVGGGGATAVDAGDDWVTLRTRRLQCWGGEPGKDFKPEPLPSWMEALCDALVARGVFSAEGRPNHVLVNEYQAGQGIMPHTDGPSYEPRTATLSLESDAIMHFSPRLAADEIGRPGVNAGPQSSVVLRARCLVVFAEEAYSRLLHGIEAVSEETVGVTGGARVINLDAASVRDGDVVKRRLRVSLTFRRVLR